MAEGELEAIMAKIGCVKGDVALIVADKDLSLIHIFMLIDDAVKEEKLPMKAAETMAEYLTSALPELKVGLIHGKMKTAARDVVMREFENGEVNVLVSTTVIEVGVNVPNASLMICLLYTSSPAPIFPLILTGFNLILAPCRSSSSERGERAVSYTHLTISSPTSSAAQLCPSEPTISASQR